MMGLKIIHSHYVVLANHGIQTGALQRGKNIFKELNECSAVPRLELL